MAACLLAFAAGASASNMAVRNDIVEAVNRDPSATWVAQQSEHFSKWTEEEFKDILGTKLGRDESMGFQYHDAATVAAAPASFDSRTKWPGLIGPILDQARCGSCWAFGAAESLSDRMAIKNASAYVALAPLDLVACDNGFFNNGCQGGQPSAAMQWAQSNGLVTEKCLPYLKSEGGPMPTCAPTSEPCMPNTFVATPACNPQCADGATYSADKHKIANAYNVPSDADQMATEIATNGPIECAFTVYQDFVGYKSGVYKHTTGSELGGHAIKIIGYGTENGEDYWLVQNSWTTTWGAKG